MDFSFVELVLVAVIAFLVLGPEELIRKSQQIGRWIGKAKTYGNNLKVLAEEEFGEKAEHGHGVDFDEDSKVEAGEESSAGAKKSETDNV